MNIKWLGHSCFLLTDSKGTSIVTDPCAPSTGYIIPSMEADAVTMSHDHYDHNYIDPIKTDVIIKEAGEYTVGDISIKGVSTYHDEVHGDKRGKNTVFTFTVDGLRVVHAGDLGAVPEDDILKEIGEGDILLVPVGGIYTIDQKGARELANKLNIRVLIPMHYKTDTLTFDLADTEDLLHNATGCAIHVMRQNEVTFTKESLGMHRIIVLKYEKPGEEE